MTAPFHILGEHRPARWLITCDHACNHVPATVAGGNLGIAPQDMARHIAWDVGAAGVAAELGVVLDASVILSDFSRLVIDPNRGEGDPTLVMKLYDGTIIPANRHAGAEEVERRLALFHRPYHQALARLAARREDTVILAMHSFTPCLKGRAPRPWQVGVLYAEADARLSHPLIDRLRAEPDLCVGDNEPYAGYLPGDAIDRHALQTGRLNTLIEVRNDLISDAEGQARWAARLAPILIQALEVADADLDDATREKLEAAAFRALIDHLMVKRPDVQNIDMMNLAGFCRNCLSRWYMEAANGLGITMDKDAARAIVYGMPYADWVAQNQTEADAAKKAAFEVAYATNVGGVPPR